MTQRLVITGCGLLGPAGQGVTALWNAMVSGTTLASHISPVVAEPSSLDESLRHRGGHHAPTILAGRVPDHLPPTFTWPQFRVASMMLLAAREAMAQAGWTPAILSDVATGLCGATSKGDVPALTAWHRRRLGRPVGAGEELPAVGSAHDFLRCMPAGPGQMLADRLAIRGPRICSVAACATGTHALIRAAQLIRHGDARRALVVAGDASIHPLLLAAFKNMGVLTTDACRPFDRDRSGFFISEGAAAVTIERADDAVVPPVVELSGWLAAADPTGLTAQDTTGQTLADAIARLLARVRMSPAEIALYSAHGTATASNDLTESRAIRLAFASHADRLHVMAAKATTGHLLGAAGLTEAVLTMQAVRCGVVPPVATFRTPDPQCRVRVAERATPADLPSAVCASLGFGGQIGLLAIRRI